MKKIIAVFVAAIMLLAFTTPITVAARYADADGQAVHFELTVIDRDGRLAEGYPRVTRYARALTSPRATGGYYYQLWTTVYLSLDGQTRQRLEQSGNSMVAYYIHAANVADDAEIQMSCYNVLAGHLLPDRRGTHAVGEVSLNAENGFSASITVSDWYHWSWNTGNRVVGVLLREYNLYDGDIVPTEAVLPMVIKVQGDPWEVEGEQALIAADVAIFNPAGNVIYASFDRRAGDVAPLVPHLELTGDGVGGAAITDVSLHHSEGTGWQFASWLEIGLSAPVSDRHGVVMTYTAPANGAITDADGEALPEGHELVWEYFNPGIQSITAYVNPVHGHIRVTLEPLVTNLPEAFAFGTSAVHCVVNRIA